MRTNIYINVITEVYVCSWKRTSPGHKQVMLDVMLRDCEYRLGICVVTHTVISLSLFYYLFVYLKFYVCVGKPIILT